MPGVKGATHWTADEIEKIYSFAHLRLDEVLPLFPHRPYSGVKRKYFEARKELGLKADRSLSQKLRKKKSKPKKPRAKRQPPMAPCFGVDKAPLPESQKRKFRVMIKYMEWAYEKCKQNGWKFDVGIFLTAWRDWLAKAIE